MTSARLDTVRQSLLILIPARYGSSRFPGKPLAPLRGAGNKAKTLVRRCLEAGQAALREGDRVAVVTDDQRIADEVVAAGGEAMMTPESCRNGTERCAAALASLGDCCDVVVNLQGDAPLIPPEFIRAVAERVAADSDCLMATPVIVCDGETLERLRADRRAGRVGGTTAVVDSRNRALYFSKEVLPYGGDQTLHHVGLYAYRPETLQDYLNWPVGRLEEAEGLEQLRFLENGRPVHCVQVEAGDGEFWEVNNPEDVPIVERVLTRRGVA